METIIDFLQLNALAGYGAAVGTLALGLNFLRYRHAVSGSKVRLKLTVVEILNNEQFSEAVKRSQDDRFGSSDKHITHEIKVRNLGMVSAHIQDAWVETSSGKENGTIRSGFGSVYRAVSQGEDIEIPPRSSKSFSLFSSATSGYLNVTRAHVIDATGKKWRSQRHKSPAS